MGMAEAVRRSHLTVKTVDRLSLGQRKSFHHVRERSPEPYVNYSDSREKIYLKLLQENSPLNPQQVFSGAPEFFKRKIGLKKDACVSSDTERAALESKSSPSLYRQRTCTACSSTTELNDELKQGKIIHTNSAKRNPNGFTAGEPHGAAKGFKTPHTEPLKPKIRRPEWKNVWNKASAPSLNANVLPGKRTHQAAKRKMSSSVIQEISAEGNLWESIEPQPKSQDNIVHEKKIHGRGRHILDESPKAGYCHAQMQTVQQESTHNILCINGSVVSFKGYGTEKLSNWFGKSEVRSGRGRRILRKLDFSGFSDKEITMKICDGKKFVIEGNTMIGHQNGPEKKLRHSFRLPEALDVESLFLSRNSQGYLFIEKKV